MVSIWYKYTCHMPGIPDYHFCFSISLSRALLSGAGFLSRYLGLCRNLSESLPSFGLLFPSQELKCNMV